MKYKINKKEILEATDVISQSVNETEKAVNSLKKKIGLTMLGAGFASGIASKAGEYTYDKIKDNLE